MAEYYEIFRVASITKPMLRIPESYRMGEGHLKFFYDKGKYLRSRSHQLYLELRKRGFKVSRKKYLIENHPRGYKKDWQPSLKDQEINRIRINKRISEKPELYTKRAYK
jgi:deoxyribonuclease (pyrimidine dimer)